MEKIILFGILDILKSFGVIIASAVAVWGINSWRRQAKWERKYELAEEVLANFYEAHQAIRIIRSPIGFGKEGSSRQKKENETLKETEIYNQAYVSRERFERNKTPFEKLHTLKYRFIALNGREYEEPFDKFNQIINKIFLASDQIAMVKLGQYEDDKELTREILKEGRRYLYSRTQGDDEIENDLKNALKIIEDKCLSIIGKNS